MGKVASRHKGRKTAKVRGKKKRSERKLRDEHSMKGNAGRKPANGETATEKLNRGRKDSQT